MTSDSGAESVSEFGFGLLANSSLALSIASAAARDWISTVLRPLAIDFVAEGKMPFLLVLAGRLSFLSFLSVMVKSVA